VKSKTAFTAKAKKSGGKQGKSLSGKIGSALGDQERGIRGGCRNLEIQGTRSGKKGDFNTVLTGSGRTLLDPSERRLQLAG